MAWLTQILTGPDNRTHDIARVLCAMIILVALALTIYSVVPHTSADGKSMCGMNFDLVAFGAGMAQILGATGIFIKLKEKSEPGEIK